MRRYAPQYCTSIDQNHRNYTLAARDSIQYKAKFDYANVKITFY